MYVVHALYIQYNTFLSHGVWVYSLNELYTLYQVLTEQHDDNTSELQGKGILSFSVYKYSCDGYA